VQQIQYTAPEQTEKRNLGKRITSNLPCSVVVHNSRHQIKCKVLQLQFIINKRFCQSNGFDVGLQLLTVL